LQASELQMCLLGMSQEYGIPVPQASQTQTLLKKFDSDGDGALILSEFEEFFRRVLLRSRQTFMQYKVHSEFFVEKQSGDPWKVYEVKKKLGEGTFGITHLVKDVRSGQTRVLKTVNKANSNMEPEELEQEIKNLKTLDHPHIIKIFEYYEDGVNVYLVMEEALGGELVKVMEEQYASGTWSLTERWAATVMQQVLEAIAYCHVRKLIHKDLKAENIMLLRKSDTRTHPHAVVIDLGLAEMFGSSMEEKKPGQQASMMLRAGRSQDDIDNVLYRHVRSRRAGGTPSTMAPEVWMAYAGTGDGFGMKCDVYSLGVVMFQLLTGALPFMGYSINPAEWLGLIKRGPPMDKLRNCTIEAQNLVGSMLAPEAVRPTAREALKHTWFTLQSTQMEAALSQEQMKALIEFEKKNEFQKAIILQAASQIRSADLPRINAIFRKHDSDNTGYLEEKELVSALGEMGIEKSVAQRAFKAVDLAGNGKIEYTEFVAACISMYDNRLQDCLWQIFKKLDTTGKGVLTREQVTQVLADGELRGLGCAPSGCEIQAIVEGMDSDHNGFISFNEFCNYVNPHNAQPEQRPRAQTRIV